MRTHRAFQRLYIFEGENMSTLKNTFFIPQPETPTQAGPENIFYDFNDGARVLLPEGKWHVRLLDADSENILFYCDTDKGWVTSTKKYFVRFRIQVIRRQLPRPHRDNYSGLFVI